jgi:Fungal specific transcription factor domain
VKPRFPLFPQIEDNNDSISTLSRFASTPDSNSTTLNPRWFPSNPILLAVIETMRRISRALGSPDLCRPDRAAISYRIHLTEHRLLSVDDGRSTPPKSNVSIITRDLSLPFRLAAILYFRISIRELPPTARMHVTLVQRIRCILEPSSSSSLLSVVDSCNYNKSLELLAWIAFMGGATSSNNDDHQYFVGLLITLCSRLGVQKRPQLQARLTGICWREGICDKHLCKLWKEMGFFRPLDRYTEDLSVESSGTLPL